MPPYLVLVAGGPITCVPAELDLTEMEGLWPWPWGSLAALSSLRRTDTWIQKPQLY